MKDNMSESLWFNDVAPYEKHIINTGEQRTLRDMASIAEKQLLEIMSAEQRALFEKYQNHVSELSLLTERECFVCGYRLGTQLTAAEPKAK